MLKIPVIKGNINRALKQFKRKFRDTQVLKFRKLSALLSPSGEETLIPLQTFACAKCGHINEGFLPKGNTENVSNIDY